MNEPNKSDRCITQGLARLSEDKHQQHRVVNMDLGAVIHNTSFATYELAQ